MGKRVHELRIVACFDIFSPTCIIPNNSTYSVKDMRSLFNHFLSKRQPYKNADQAVNQWCVLRDSFDSFRLRHTNAVDSVSVMQILLRENRYDSLDILHDLCAIVLSLPFSTAIVENTFSMMRVIKNYRTNGLSDRTLDDIMQICMNGPPEMSIEKSEEIAGLWFSIVQRRFSRYDKSMLPWPLCPEDVSAFSARAANVLAGSRERNSYFMRGVGSSRGNQGTDFPGVYVFV
ncbi:hypothetical protein FACS189472_18290 [Alphaproteobacteria bacterium]|nr:hypothetical protein FACS189472_18290 [Alphaproteobacteria bacterium]